MTVVLAIFLEVGLILLRETVGKSESRSSTSTRSSSNNRCVHASCSSICGGSNHSRGYRVVEGLVEVAEVVVAATVVVIIVAAEVVVPILEQ